jgi:ABC-2 type transport system permease protein
MMSLFSTEWTKQVRRARTYLVLAVVCLFPVLIALGVRAREDRPGRDGGEGLFQIARLAHSGIVVPAVALDLMSGLILIIVVAIFAGDIVASEANWGNLRYMLVRPISRSRLLANKLAMAFLFMFISTALISIVGLIAGVLLVGWHPINIDFNSLFLQMHVHQTTPELLWHLTEVTAYVAWGMSSVAALGFMVSTMTDTPVGAIFAAAAFGVGSEIVDAIPTFHSIRYILPLHYLDAWTELVTRGQANADMARGALLQLAYVVVFVGIAFWWFRRKDVLS